MDERKVHDMPEGPGYKLRAVCTELALLTGWNMTFCRMKPEHGGKWCLVLNCERDGRESIIKVL